MLFDSQARGDAKPDSDWDLLVLLDKPKVEMKDYDDISFALRSLGWDIDAIINTVIYSKKDWDKLSFSPFYKNVMNEGILLWD